VFGTLLAERFAAWWRAMGSGGAGPPRFDLVEAGAGNGRLTRDILDASARRDPEFYRSLSAHLVERSPAARAAQAATLSNHRARLAPSSDRLPEACEGVVFANELLDALPVHVVEMRGPGLAEVYVDVHGDALVERLGPPSTPDLVAYLADAGVALDDGARGEINLAAVAWVADAAARLRRGFLLIIDYGYEARELYSPARAQGTLATFHRHLVDAPGAETRGSPAWLADPGDRDLTSHVDFTSIRRAAERAGLETLSIVAQTRFLLEILEGSALVAEFGAPDRLQERLAVKTLLMPGGLGSTHTVMVFAKR
jgi:SAM-dependent MidA family methyltransferase